MSKTVMIEDSREHGERLLICTYPVCPFCGDINSDFAEDWGKGTQRLDEGDETKEECGVCGNEYAILLCSRPEFITSKPAQQEATDA